MYAVSYNQDHIHHAGKGIFLGDTDIFDGRIFLGNPRGHCCDKAALRSEFHLYLDWEFTFDCGGPAESHALLRVIAYLLKVATGLKVYHQPFTWRDMA